MTSNPIAPDDEGEPTRGYRRGREKRAEIVEAAMQLFAEDGYQGTSLRDIAERVGITHPGLLHHFPTKKDLLSAVLERRDRLDEQTIRDAVARTGGVVEMFELLMELNQARPWLMELSTTLSAEATAPHHPAHSYFSERYQRVITRATALFEYAQQIGALRPGLEPEHGARLLFAAMDGLQLQWLLADRQDEVDLTASIRSLLDLMLLNSFPIPPSRSRRDS